MSDACDIAVIGAGAAGLATAIFAKEFAPGARVVLLDGASRLGAKVLVSGGGRCNVTHERVSADDYFGPRNRVKKVLAAFTVEQTAAWFASLGVELKREPGGKLFPVTDEASTVLDALLGRCEQLGVEVLAGCRVSHVEHDGGFGVTHGRGRLSAGRVVLATGGRSLPKTGSDGGGYQFAQSLGHTVRPTYPALVPLVLEETFFHAAVAGIAHEVELVTRVGGKVMDRRGGSMLWTHFGVSGPVVMDGSRVWVIHHAAGNAPALHANLLPGESFDSADGRLVRAAHQHPRRTLGRVGGELLPQNLADALLRHARFDPGAAVGQLPRERRRALVHLLTDLRLPVLRDRGWNYAEVTAGGVPLEEVDTATMQSRRQRGLYLVGEVLDVDGRIGGFNFQWAWCTGRIAGRAQGVG